MSELATAFLTRLRETLPRHADPERAAAMAKYMRDQFPFLGIPSTPLAALQRELATGLPRPESADAAEIALGCWSLAEREYQYVACSYLRKYAKVLDEDFLGVARELIVVKPWWDTVDALAAHVVGPLVSAYPSLVRVMDQWAEQDEMWLTRTAILHQLRYKGATDADRLFRYCRRQAGHPDFFIRKAIGWALREYAKTEPDAVRKFVAATELSGLSRREALKNL
ncbi:MAG: DNA alkylation repair protein [Hamadaea sp.]|nr:DNA alkylation repair protein [Hamadaea sp.]NUR47209.1 DNA alkylation repair protein [Hamadaea sp.]NUT03095.1 DNA alkylation repair protein [Hamadaea sp.]